MKIFLVSVLIIFIYVGYMLVIKPMMDKIDILSSQIDGQKNRLNKDRRLIKKAKTVDDEINNSIQKFKQDKSNEQVMSSIISEIESVAGGLNLKISDLKPNKARKSEYFNHFSVSLTIDSEFTDVLNFIYVLQDPEHLYNVDEVRFDKSSRRRSTEMKSYLVLSKTLIPEI